MKMSKWFRILAATLCMALLLSACGGGTEASGDSAGASTGSEGDTAEAALDLNSLTLDEIISGAKEEGKLESVGMPDSWANWGLTWADIEAEYGI